MCHGSKLRNAVCTTCKRLKQTNISIYLAVAPRVSLAMCLSFDSLCIICLPLPLTMSLDFCYIASFRDMQSTCRSHLACAVLRMVKDDDSVSEDTVLEVDFDMNSPGDLAA